MQRLLKQLRTTSQFTREENLELFTLLIRVFFTNDKTSIQEAKHKALQVWKRGYATVDNLLLDFLSKHLHQQGEFVFIQKELERLHTLFLQSDYRLGCLENAQEVELSNYVCSVSITLQNTLPELSISGEESQKIIMIRVHQFLVALHRISMNMDIEVTQSNLQFIQSL